MRCVTRGCTIAEDKNAIVRTEMIYLNPAVVDDSYPTVNKFVCENVSYINLSQYEGSGVVELFPMLGICIITSHSVYYHDVTISAIEDGKKYTMNRTTGFIWHENSGGIPYITPSYDSAGDTAVAIGYCK